jgi:hypothetical protein
MSPIKIIGIVLIIAGAYICYLGTQRRDSFAGGIDTASTKMANTFGGEGHMADHTWYFVGGGALIVVGALGLFRSSRP